jgi:hypothetical protein
MFNERLPPRQSHPHALGRQPSSSSDGTIWYTANAPVRSNLDNRFLPAEDIYNTPSARPQLYANSTPNAGSRPAWSNMTPSSYSSTPVGPTTQASGQRLASPTVRLNGHQDPREVGPRSGQRATIMERFSPVTEGLPYRTTPTLGSYLNFSVQQDTRAEVYDAGSGMTYLPSPRPTIEPSNDEMILDPAHNQPKVNLEMCVACHVWFLDGR